MVCPESADCSTTCGTGQQRREVFSVEQVDANVDRRVNAQHCQPSQKAVKCLRAGDEQFHEFHCSGKKPVQEQECGPAFNAPAAWRSRETD
ncbi:hypothetical protein niasHT_025550 [Heterodera trifolii]|uniref:Uncharacterized protein n=1 Tax=Heterodera trifolii TaxID=157864 RepID=A0ABD2K887_9BILA